MLAAQCGGDDPKIHKAYIWKLVCWMIHSMFKEMRNRRTPGTANTMLLKERTVEQRRSKAASILEGAVAGHKFMAELVKHEFIRHPIFASTMTEFLLKTKASHVSMLDVIKKQAALETKFAGLQSIVDKMVSKVGNQGGGQGGRGGRGGGPS